MHLGQIRADGGIIAAVFENGIVRPIPGHTMVDLIQRAEAEGIGLVELAAQISSRHPENRKAVLPIHPREVWGCACTYDNAGRHERPEIYFKGTARMCVGPGAPIGIRSDSRFTSPEPELAVVLGSRGSIAGYTLANDVSAVDIEREHPLYSTQAKAYQGSCALGPVIVTPGELSSPFALEMSCTVERGGETLFSGRVSTSSLAGRLEPLIRYLLRSNPVPAGSVLLTGTGIIVPEEAALRPGDVVTVRIPVIGELSNPAELV
jgi:2-dehydro-3-deoxy-D-arabinonate dehydratase